MGFLREEVGGILNKILNIRSKKYQKRLLKRVAKHRAYYSDSLLIVNWIK
jgi:hypothetical protein